MLISVIEARAKATQIKVDASTVTDPTKFKEYQDGQNQLTAALGRLLVTVERYPDLKSNQNFLALQSQLEKPREPDCGRAARLLEPYAFIIPSSRRFLGSCGRRRSIAATSRWRHSQSLRTCNALRT